MCRCTVIMVQRQGHCALFIRNSSCTSSVCKHVSVCCVILHSFLLLSFPNNYQKLNIGAIFEKLLFQWRSSRTCWHFSVSAVLNKKNERMQTSVYICYEIAHIKQETVLQVKLKQLRALVYYEDLQKCILGFLNLTSNSGRRRTYFPPPSPLEFNSYSSTLFISPL